MTWASERWRREEHNDLSERVMEGAKDTTASRLLPLPRPRQPQLLSLGGDLAEALPGGLPRLPRRSGLARLSGSPRLLPLPFLESLRTRELGATQVGRGVDAVGTTCLCVPYVRDIIHTYRESEGQGGREKRENMYIHTS